MRVKKTALVMDWEENRQPELRKLLGEGIIPIGFSGEGEVDLTANYPLIMGAVRSHFYFSLCFFVRMGRSGKGREGEERLIVLDCRYRR